MERSAGLFFAQSCWEHNCIWFIDIHFSFSGLPQRPKSNKQKWAKLHNFSFTNTDARRTALSYFEHYYRNFILFRPTSERDEHRNYYFRRCCNSLSQPFEEISIAFPFSVSTLCNATTFDWKRCTASAIIKINHKLVCGNEMLCTRKRLNKCASHWRAPCKCIEKPTTTKRCGKK